MANQDTGQTKQQSGIKIAIGVIGFMIGLIVILWILKDLMGM